MKILFQGNLGAYSHLAAIEVYPDAEIVPCKTFDECFSKANEDENIRIIIPESNRITGNIGVEYLIFKYRLNIYAEHFHSVEHHLLGFPGSKIKDIENVYSHAQALSQSTEFIRKNNFVENVRADTAGSAKYVSEKKNNVKDFYRPFSNQEISRKIADILKINKINAELDVIFQEVNSLHKACPDNIGDWYFTGDYPTPGGNRVVNRAFINFYEGKSQRAY